MPFAMKLLVTIVVVLILVLTLVALWAPTSQAAEPPAIRFSESENGYAPLASISSQPLSFVIHGNGLDGKPLAVIHPDGRVELNGDPNEAARVFWQAVGRLYPKCDERH